MRRVLVIVRAEGKKNDLEESGSGRGDRRMYEERKGRYSENTHAFSKSFKRNQTGIAGVVKRRTGRRTCRRVRESTKS